MSIEIDPRTIRSERHVDIGRMIERDAELIIERWTQRALQEQPDAQPEYRAEMRNHLTRFVVVIGRALASSETDAPSAPGIVAVEHGEQRWQAGWKLTEVIRDYQILRLVILEHLESLLPRPLQVREAMALGLALDESITAATVTYVAYEQAHARESEARIRQVMEQSNRDLEEYSARSDAANRAKSEFLANMSHEIRTPMTAILGFAEELLSKVSDPGSTAAVHTIKRNGEYLLEIVNDILDLSKIEAGKLEIQQVACSPAQILADVQSLMQVRAQAKGIPFELEYPEPIPESIQTDPVHLRQILINLVGNAVKFTAQGKVRLVTQLIEVDGVKCLQFKVIDTGIGIAAENIENLFEPFSQAHDSSVQRFEGTGLGLPISKRLAELLGGKITVASEVGKGSCFCVTIDIGSLEGITLLNPSAAPLETPRAAAEPVIQLNCRVLVADDRRDNRFLIQAILGKVGAEVTAVENGNLAVQMVQRAEIEKLPFDVILMDMQMPLLDGYEAAAQLRSAGCKTPIIALTASAMAGDRQRCIDAGCDDYTPKPIDRRHLIELVARYCQTETPESDAFSKPVR